MTDYAGRYDACKRSPALAQPAGMGKVAQEKAPKLLVGGGDGSPHRCWAYMGLGACVSIVEMATAGRYPRPAGRM